VNKPIVHTLTELTYSADRKGALKLYIYATNSAYHNGGHWFERNPRYPDEEINTDQARKQFDLGMESKREIRICNGMDFLVLHAKDGVMIYPPTAEEFWNSI
jgi:hypothetical protein